MGYRSDVGLCLQRSAYLKLRNAGEALRYTDTEIYKLVQSLLEHPQRTLECAEAVVLYWDSVKSHSGYDDVRWLENLLSGLEAEDYLFLRIGEEADDIEAKGCYWDNPFGMYVARDIAFEN